jgi:hypothetical protein
MREKFLHLRITTEKIMIFYILIFKLFDKNAALDLLDNYIYNSLRTRKLEACITYGQEDVSVKTYGFLGKA